jgi:membrane associated rhomboid family serine protease
MFRRSFVLSVFLIVAGLMAAISACWSDGDSSGPATGATEEVVALQGECTTAFRDQAGEPLSTEVVALSTAVPNVEIKLGTLEFGGIYFN